MQPPEWKKTFANRVSDITVAKKFPCCRRELRLYVGVRTNVYIVRLCRFSKLLTATVKNNNEVTRNLTTKIKGSAAPFLYAYTEKMKQAFSFIFIYLGDYAAKCFPFLKFTFVCLRQDHTV